LLANASQGEGLIFGVTETAERKAQFRFSDTIYANYVWVVTRSDRRFPFRSMADLKGKTLGVARGVSYGDEFDRQRNVLFAVEEDSVNSYAVRLRKLWAQRMDAMLYGDWRANPDEIEAKLNRMVREQAGDSALAGASFSVLPT